MFFFFYLFLIGGAAFWMYKYQEDIFVMIPSWGLSKDWNDFYFNFWVIWSIGAGCIFIQMVIKLYSQSVCTDVFFIDWERPTSFAVSKEQQKASKKAVSIWRTLLVCNEFNELSTDRYISRTYTFLISAFLLIYMKWQYMAVEQPSRTTEIRNVQMNYFLRFFITNSTIMFVGLIQMVLKHAISLKFPTPIMDFTDLLPIANISIWISNVKDKCHGYYVHGQSPGGDTEGTMEDLRVAFLKEEY